MIKYLRMVFLLRAERRTYLCNFWPLDPQHFKGIEAVVDGRQRTTSARRMAQPFHHLVLVLGPNMQKLSIIFVWIKAISPHHATCRQGERKRRIISFKTKRSAKKSIKSLKVLYDDTIIQWTNSSKTKHKKRTTFFHNQNHIISDDTRLFKLSTLDISMKHKWSNIAYSNFYPGQQYKYLFLELNFYANAFAKQQ